MCTVLLPQGVNPSAVNKYIIYYISYRIISYRIVSYHIISHRIISYHIISYHIISYHIITIYPTQDTMYYQNTHVFTSCLPRKRNMYACTFIFNNVQSGVRWMSRRFPTNTAGRCMRRREATQLRLIQTYHAAPMPFPCHAVTLRV